MERRRSHRRQRQSRIASGKTVQVASMQELIGGAAYGT
jgi:hypothetical protein